MDLLNPPVLNGSDILVEADVIMSQQQWDAMHAATVKGAPRKAIPWGFYRWPVSQSTGLPTATYRIDSSGTAQESFQAPTLEVVVGG